MTKRLGALSTLVWDRILNPFADAAPSREQWGGAVYSYSSLAATCPDGWEAVPIVKVGRDLEQPAGELLSGLPRLCAGTGVVPVDAPNNRVELRYHDAMTRSETQSGGVPPWNWAELAPIVRGLDALYVNYISGAELDLETTTRLRGSFAGPIYADLHSLFLSPPSEQPRRHRPLPDWQVWLRCFDAVQLNETELGLLAGSEDPEAFALTIPDFGPGLVVITLGERGVRFVIREGLPADPLTWPPHPEPGPVRTGVIAPPAGNVAGDYTGCGDVFGAALVASLLGGLPIERALARAQLMATTKIRHPDTRHLYSNLRAALMREAAC